MRVICGTGSPGIRSNRTDDRTGTPGWLSADLGSLSGKVMRLPDRAEIDANLNEQLIVEFYSR